MAEGPYKLKSPKEIKTLATELKKPESQAYIEELRQLVESPENQRQVPPDTRQALRESIQMARDAYDTRANRNDWLEVAQTLGQAVARFGAAQQGLRSGKDMTSVTGGPGIDYGARTDRAFREMQQGISDARFDVEETRQRYDDTEKARQQNLGTRTDYLSTAARLAAQKEAQRESEGREEARLSRALNRQDQKESELLYKQQRADLAKDENREKEATQNMRDLTGTLMREDLSGKNRDKVIAKYGPVAAKAGVDINTAIVEAEKLKDAQPGWWSRKVGGKQGKTPQELQSNLYSILSVRGELDKLSEFNKARRKALEGTTNPLSAEQLEQLRGGAPETGNPPSTVRIQAPDGTIAEVPADKVEKYIQKGGKVVK